LCLLHFDQRRSQQPSQSLPWHSILTVLHPPKLHSLLLRERHRSRYQRFLSRLRRQPHP
jgi:hypothetical protein